MPHDDAGVHRELSYVLLLFGLFVVPRFLQRYRVRAAITSLALGAVLGMGFGLFQHDATVELLSTFGIVALFLFAGLDSEVDELRREARVLGEHLVIRLLMVGGLRESAAREHGRAALVPGQPAFRADGAATRPSPPLPKWAEVL